MHKKGSCLVCQRKDLGEINRQILARDLSFGVLGKQFGLSKITLWRHAKRCLSSRMNASDAINTGLSELVAAIDAYGKRLERATKRVKRFSLREWLQGDAALRAWANTKARLLTPRLAAKPETPLPTGSELDSALWGEVEKVVIDLAAKPEGRDWLGWCFLKAGWKAPVEANEPLTARLVRDRDFRELVRLTLIEADNCLEQPMPNSFTIPSADSEQ